MTLSADGRMERYFELMRARPDLFENVADGIEILLDPETIARAQSEVRDKRVDMGLESDDLRVGMIADDPFMTFVRDAVRFPDGSLGLHNRIVERESVAVLPLLDGKPVLINIFRHGLRGWSLEFPRGAVEAGESHEDSVRRELLEEIGAHTLDIVPVGKFTPGGSSLSIIAGLYVATIDRVGTPQQAEGIAEIKTVTCEELEELISSGEIIDGFSLSLFARARLSGLI